MDPGKMKVFFSLYRFMSVHFIAAVIVLKAYFSFPGFHEYGPETTLGRQEWMILLCIHPSLSAKTNTQTYIHKYTHMYVSPGSPAHRK